MTAYLVYWAYRKNSVRFFLKTDDADPDQFINHREYGDPELLVQTIRAAVLGGTPRLLVEGSDLELPERPTLTDVLPPDDAEDAEGARQALFDEQLDEWETARRELDAATARQAWLDQWWSDELAAAKVIETENNAVGLGDGVYELVNSTEKGRTRLRIHDPGFYFPVHDDGAQGDDFPRKIHLAWEWEDDAGMRFVRRITYEIVRLADVGLGETRVYPYAAGESSKYTCLKSDATWRVDQLGGAVSVNDFALDRAKFAVNEDGEVLDELDLEIDFIPVVHVPNTSAIIELWGESALMRIAQILDDLMANDTDSAISASLVAAPPIAVSGLSTGGTTIETYGPGTVFHTGDGTATLLDTSRSLDALLKWNAALLDRLSVNRQVPQSVIGRVDLSNDLAGITLLLSFGPFRQYIDDLRLPRDSKYKLLAKFVQRMSIAAGELDGDPLEAGIAFGSFLPTDESAVVQLIDRLLSANVISRATAMRMAQEAGIDIDSIEDELEAVARLDFTGAKDLADALGDEGPARRYLRIPEDTTPPATTVAPPVAPGGQAEGGAGDVTGEPAPPGEPEPLA